MFGVKIINDQLLLQHPSVATNSYGQWRLVTTLDKVLSDPISSYVLGTDLWWMTPVAGCRTLKYYILVKYLTLDDV